MKVNPINFRRRPRRRGVFLVEATISLVLLVALALVVMKTTVTTLRARKWGIVQGMTDSYLTYEVAYAARIPFEDFLSPGSAFPLSPNFDTETVTVGTMPNGVQVTGTVYRTRIEDGGNADSLLEVENWKLRSVLIYELDGRTYAKSRTIPRTR